MTIRFRGAPSGPLYTVQQQPFVSVDFDPQAEGVVAWQEGRVWYNSDQHSFSIYDDIPGTSLEVGQEVRVRVYNHDVVSIPDGAAVYFSGAQGNRPKINLAIATAEESSRCVGLATHTIPQHTEGWVTAFGAVHDYDTHGFSADGVPLFLSDTVAGALTDVAPVAPSYIVRVGLALNTTVHGIVFVNPYKQF